MQLSIFSPVLAAMKLDKALDYVSSLGVDALELGVGGFPGTAHADIRELAADEKKVRELKKLFDDKGVRIAALSVHGNGVHPTPEIAEKATDEFEKTCRVAEMLGVERVITFSGCPGDGKGDKPNWIVCPWPNDFSDVLEYQWNDVLIPYWRKEIKGAENAGVKVCFEMHPGFCVYNPATMLRIRAAVGKTLGANFDPSHLIWQGIDCVEAIKTLGDAIYYFHAKDTAINPTECRVNGVLDTKPYSDELRRSWIFRTVGYGSDTLFWKSMISALHLVGYDHVISIEHEDSLMTPKEGLEKAVSFLKDLIIRDGQKADMWWI